MDTQEPKPSHVEPQNSHSSEEITPSPPERKDGHLAPSTELSSQTATAAPSHSSQEAGAGMWGEAGTGQPVSERVAMEDYEEMQRELLVLTKTRSRKSERSLSRPNLRDRVLTKKSTNRSARLAKTKTEDLEDGDAGSETSGEGDFKLGDFLREGKFEKRLADGEASKRVGVTWKNLTVTGMASGAMKVKTLPKAIMNTFGPDLYNIICYFVPVLRFTKPSQTRELIRDFTGVVRDGEMMLVLGRPGSGCTTFLKAVANERGGYVSVKGDVTYGGIPAGEQAKHYRGEVIYNEEDDAHLPVLTVWQTLQFTLWTKTKRRFKQEIEVIGDALLRMFAMTHTKQTPVGNEFVPGVSGGERKRVSIIETLATRSTVTCWDNSTRGLDASTALDYARSLRIMTDVSRRTTLVTLYQAGQEIYDLMDKVMVIEDGRCLFEGRASEARQYFVDLGFYASERVTTADFLTSVCDLNERQFRKGYEKSCPKTPAELEAAYKKSAHYQRVLDDVKEYEAHWKTSDMTDAKNFRNSVLESKSHRTVPHQSNYTVSFWRQVVACTRREFWLMMGDKTELYTKFFVILANALIVGSLFYGQPLDTQGAFSRGGTVFFSIIFLGWLQLTELMKAVTGRSVVARHKEYAFYRPGAVALARVFNDLPVLLSQVIVFAIIMYFIAGLAMTPAKFFIYMLIVYVTTLNMTALYRMLAAFSPTINDAVRFSGVTLNVLLVFTGYVIYKPVLLGQKIWFGWIYWINPLSYAFEAILSNEFGGREMQCSPQQLVPQGPGIDPQYQGCAVAGSQVGNPTVSGDDYLASQFSYYRVNLWRNFGIVIALTVFYIFVTIVATESFSLSGGGGGATMFSKLKPKSEADAATPEAADEKGDGASRKVSRTMSRTITRATTKGEVRQARTQDEVLADLTRSESVFTWTNLTLDVPTPMGPKRLLNSVNGYAKPGVMVALMGASGAGKTTLLNTLSQRMPFGTIGGNMLVDGREPGIEFKRGTGFVEQNYIHEEFATVRETLEFSAFLRQNRNLSKEDKQEYVEQIIDLLELRDLEHAVLVSLSLEQKKRVTIGAELSAKPDLLLFLDEPTSGLDSQSAFSIVRFLKKLTAAGQAIVCTIHQPSSMLIQQFDMILALNPGGNVFYFGDVGANGSEVIRYFADRGAPCPPQKNIAEFILETAAKTRRRADGSKLDWNKEWKESKENATMNGRIKALEDQRREAPLPATDTQHEFAAPVWTQVVLLTKRMFINQWREPSYVYGIMFTATLAGIINGFTFWSLGNTVSDMLYRMFSSFLILMLPPAVVNAVVPKFYMSRALWEFREGPARIYGWIAFCTATVVTEIPVSIISATIYYLVWYFPTGLPRDASTAGYAYLMTILWFLFQASWGQWITAFAPSFTVISNVLPFFFVVVTIFNGVVTPWSQLSVFWRYWMYYVNPSTWWIGGMLSATLPGIQIRCAENEAAYFNPPPGQTCAAYAQPFVDQSGRGYLINPTDSANCGYCPYTDGTAYIEALNIYPGDKWRNFGIFLVFTVFNWFLVYFFIYTCRVRGWTFGFGPLFGVLGSLVGLVMKPFQRSKKEEAGEKA